MSKQDHAAIARKFAIGVLLRAAREQLKMFTELVQETPEPEHRVQQQEYQARADELADAIRLIESSNET